MQLYTYDLGFFPLDWEFCFMQIEDYKAFLTRSYAEKETFYQHAGAKLGEVLRELDELLEAAMEDWVQQFPRNNELRCPPMVFALPRGDLRGGAVFGMVLKRDEDGDTLVYSPVPLPHLKEV